jgi:acyl carrier protein
VKLRGIRLELDAIEHELRLLPGVRQAVVAVRSAPDGGQRLVGWVTVDAGCSADALLRDLRARLSRSMVPDVLTAVERIPLTPAGKPDLAALLDAPADPESAVDSGTPEDQGGGGLFPALAALIAKILSVPAGSITARSTIHNTWGWNSLRHMLLMMELEENFGVSLSDPEISAATSVAGIEQLLLSKGVEFP